MTHTEKIAKAKAKLMIEHPRQEYFEQLF